jgi:Tol biopolymer transport system component
MPKAPPSPPPRPFTPVRLTNFTKDDGIMMSAIKISDDGSTAVFLRGEQPNREGWSPNASADPNGPEHAIWAAHTNAPGAWRVVDAANPEIAPDGSSILFVKEGQIYRAKLTPVKPATEVDRGEKPFITEWGVQSDRPNGRPTDAKSPSSAPAPITALSRSTTWQPAR